MLRLVSVEGEAIPDATLTDELSDFVERVATGEHGDAAGVISVVVLQDGGMKICWFGEDYSSYELIGLFEAAKFRVMADDALSDE